MKPLYATQKNYSRKNGEHRQTTRPRKVYHKFEDLFIDEDERKRANKFVDNVLKENVCYSQHKLTKGKDDSFVASRFPSSGNDTFDRLLKSSKPDAKEEQRIVSKSASFVCSDNSTGNCSDVLYRSTTQFDVLALQEIDSNGQLSPSLPSVKGTGRGRGKRVWTVGSSKVKSSKSNLPVKKSKVSKKLASKKEDSDWQEGHGTKAEFSGLVTATKQKTIFSEEDSFVSPPNIQQGKFGRKSTINPDSNIEISPDEKLVISDFEKQEFSSNKNPTAKLSYLCLKYSSKRKQIKSLSHRSIDNSAGSTYLSSTPNMARACGVSRISDVLLQNLSPVMPYAADFNESHSRFNSSFQGSCDNASHISGNRVKVHSIGKGDISSKNILTDNITTRRNKPKRVYNWVESFAEISLPRIELVPSPDIVKVSSVIDKLVDSSKNVSKGLDVANHLDVIDKLEKKGRLSRILKEPQSVNPRRKLRNLTQHLSANLKFISTSGCDNLSTIAKRVCQVVPLDNQDISVELEITSSLCGSPSSLKKKVLSSCSSDEVSDKSHESRTPPGARDSQEQGDYLNVTTSSDVSSFDLPEQQSDLNIKLLPLVLTNSSVLSGIPSISIANVEAQRPFSVLAPKDKSDFRYQSRILLDATYSCVRQGSFLDASGQCQISLTPKAGKGWKRSLAMEYFNKSESASFGKSRRRCLLPIHISISSHDSMGPYQSKILSHLMESAENIDMRNELLRLCDQVDILNMMDCFTDSRLSSCNKIGEGVFGEVFMVKPNGVGVEGSLVLKVMPIEGNFEVNQEPQKTFASIYSEVYIAVQLSNLRDMTATSLNSCSCFVHCQRCWVVRGQYPSGLVQHWDDFHEKKSSENDRPDIFPETQLFAVLEFGHGGQDLESFVFNNAGQSLSVFMQIAHSLAVAEKELKFEHRDLHWGNVLVSVTKEKWILFNLEGKTITLDTQGVRATLIDFTMSRIERDDTVVYIDLGDDETLFTAEGDYQFEIYRRMRNANGNDWQKFTPLTNVFWLHYLLDKMCKMCYYKNETSKIHAKNLTTLNSLCDQMLEFESAADFVERYHL